MDLTPANLTALNQAFTTRWEKGMTGYTELHPRFAQRVESITTANVYTMLAMMSGMKEFKGEIEIDAPGQDSFTVPNVDYYDAKGVPVNAIKDDQYGQYGNFMQKMGQATKAHVDVKFAALLLNAFNETDYTGSAFFGDAKSHITGAKKKGVATFDNKMTKQFTEEHFETARKMLLAIKFPNGVTANQVVNLKLIHGPAIAGTVRKVLNAQLVATGGTNVWTGAAEPVEIPMLGDSPYWFLCNGDEAFMFQDREAPSFTAKDKPTDDNVFHQKELQYKTERRFAVAPGLPQTVVGSTGADA
jgi:phage major head subunit gpT-like protein